MKAIERHYVEFYSPGTFFSECSRRPIDAWDAKEACKLASAITERHGAKPFSFRFVTLLEADPVDDGRGGKMNIESKELRRSSVYHLGGRVILFHEVPLDKEHAILRDNMRCNREAVVIENTNSYRVTSFFGADDVLLSSDGCILRSGCDPFLVEYRRKTIAFWEKERQKEFGQ